MNQGQVPQKSVSSDKMDTDIIQSHKSSEEEILSSHRESMSSNGGDSSNHSDSGDDNSGIKFEDWGFQVDRLFDVAYRFYKRNESKAFYPTYEERNQLIALILQARYGNFDGGKAPDVGALDLVGRSRRQHWATLKGMSKTEAMSKFIFTLNELCPFFKAHVEAVKISCDVQTIVDNVQPNIVDEQQIPSTASNSIKKDEKLKAIYTSLCRQTYQQFKGYAMKQYPKDVQQQKYLISSLQEQYYQQYISQMHPELNHNSSSKDQLKSSLSPTASESASSISHDNGDNMSTTSTKTIEQDLNVNIVKQNNTPTRDNLQTDQPTDKTKPPEIHTLIGGEKDYSPISIVGDRQETSNPSFETNQVVTNNGSSLNESNIQPAKQEIQRQGNISQESNNFSVTKPESPLPEPNPYQPINLQSIGKFEAFPRPKPISRYPQPVNITKEVTQTIATKDKDQKVTKPAYTAIDLGDVEPPAKIVELSDIKPTLLPQELPNMPPLELPPLPPSIIDQESRASSPPSESFQQTRIETCLSNDLNNQHTPATEEIGPIVMSENQQPKEYWDGDDSSSSSDDSPLEHSVSYEPIEPATIWTKRGGNEFKESLVDDKHGGLYVVKQGTLVTIQVPTYPDGRYIYWEFATEDYDIGFGLDFIYEINLIKPLAIKIYEETDEDNDEDTDELVDGINSNQINDPELAVSDGLSQDLCLIEQKKAEKFTRLANTVSILPTYRRDSHEEIFVGRHKYPGKGYYLLKFDNTYSVLRSKTIFFRICYFI